MNCPIHSLDRIIIDGISSAMERRRVDTLDSVHVEFGDGSKVLDQSQSHPEVQARINLLFIASPWRYRWLRPSQSGNVFADPNRSQSELIHYLSLPGSSR